MKDAVIGELIPLSERVVFPQAALFQTPTPEVAEKIRRQKDLERRALHGEKSAEVPAAKAESGFTPQLLAKPPEELTSTPSKEITWREAPDSDLKLMEPRKSLRIKDPVTGFTIKFPILDISREDCGWVILVPTDAETSFIPPMGAKVVAEFEGEEETLIYFGINNVFPDRRFNVLVLQKL
jgi:hypothetical protein